MNESRIVSAINREMTPEYEQTLAAVSRAATDYMESLLPEGDDSSLNGLTLAAGVVFGHDGDPIVISDGCDVFPPVRVVTLQRPVKVRLAPDHIVNVDASTSKGVALEAALVAMAEFMNRVHSSVNLLRVAGGKEAA
ncbi:MAG: hypothetical protein ACRDC7_00485 [Aeromonas veronii]